MRNDIFGRADLKSDIINVIVSKNCVGKKKNGNKRRSGSLSSYQKQLVDAIYNDIKSEKKILKIHGSYCKEYLTVIDTVRGVLLLNG